MHHDNETTTVTAVGDSAVVRWTRRSVSIPSMLLGTVIAVVLAPVIAVGLAIADLTVGRRRLPRLRVFGMVLQYLVNDSVEIVLAPVLWVWAGFGTRLGSTTSRRRHARLQRWSIDLLATRADQLLGLRIEVDGEAGLTPAPAIVLSRHVSLADASVPGLLYGEGTGIDVRGVIMAEMLSDPGFDLLYGRLGSVFIRRDGDATARRAVHDLAAGLDSRSVAVIFPEGRLFDPTALERSLARLSERDPVRAARLAGLRHVLPPRPGGVLSLLAGAPNADVVVIGHVGFEAVPGIGALSRRAPVGQSISVSVRRIARDGIPDDPAEQVAWLDEEWIRLDDRIHEVLAAQGAIGRGFPLAAVS